MIRTATIGIASQAATTKIVIAPAVSALRSSFGILFAAEQ